MRRPIHAHIVIGCLLVALASACSKTPTSPDDTPGRTQVAITAQPQDQVVTAGTSATLRVAAAGPGGLGYQWYAGETGVTSSPVAGAVDASFITPPVTTPARYWVRVASGGQTADSVTATVTVDGAAPFIREEPADATIARGETVHLAVEVIGSPPLSFQWYRRGPSGRTTDPIAGATASHYTTPALTDTMTYWVRVSNPAGSVDSRTATITVVAPPGEPDPPAPPPAPPSPPPAPDIPTPPAPPPPNPGHPALEHEVLVLINQQRATGASCGGVTYPAVGALAMNGALQAAARGHSQDMGTRRYFSHTSPDGQTFMQRISAAGFNGSGPYGENIGAGYPSAAAVVAGWMASPGHCQNIMANGFRQAGVGYASVAGAPYGSYWTLDFAGG